MAIQLLEVHKEVIGDEEHLEKIAHLHYLIGDSYNIIDDDHTSIEYYEAALKYNILSSSITDELHTYLSDLYIKYIKKYTLVIEHLKQSLNIKINQDNENILDIALLNNEIGWYYYMINDCISALPYCQKAMSLYEKDSKCACHQYGNLPPMDYWIKKIDNAIDKERYKIQHIVANGPYTSSTQNHAIFSAFLFAYNSHEDIILSPDDIWLMICIYFSQYINENAQQLRTLLIEHSGRKRLIVEQSDMIEPDWKNFFEHMQIELGKNVKNDVMELLTCNFSTTTKIESFLSCVAIMDIFKKYFEYEYYITMCGIRNVHFMGTLEDWKLLRNKTAKLKNLTAPTRDNFGSYIDGLLPIIDQFIQTYQGNVDNQFWNKVMDIEHVGGGESG
ncbi:unnamed protein product, partial [Rotaria sp. Silwood2]